MFTMKNLVLLATMISRPETLVSVDSHLRAYFRKKIYQQNIANCRDSATERCDNAATTPALDEQREGRRRGWRRGHGRPRRTPSPEQTPSPSGKSARYRTNKLRAMLRGSDSARCSTKSHPRFTRDLHYIKTSLNCNIEHSLTS